MKYIVCEEPLRFALKEKEPPLLNSNEALVKIHRVGICGTDLHAFTGNQAFFTYPRILGHELAGEVVEIGATSSPVKIGDKVIVMPYVSCGSCVACTKGKTNCCTQLQVLGVHTDGGMQEIIAVRADLLLPVSHLSYNEMAIVEPLAIGAHALRRAGIQSGETIAVLGCGPIGIGIMKLAQLAGAQVIAIDTNEQRLDYAKQQIGVDFKVKAGSDVVKEVARLTQGNLCSAVFDATGNKVALESCPDFLSHGGRIVLVGLSKGELSYHHPAIHAKEASILCSRNATLEDFLHVIRVLDKFPTQTYIGETVPFAQVMQEFDRWLDPNSGIIKATVDFSSEALE